MKYNGKNGQLNLNKEKSNVEISLREKMSHSQSKKHFLIMFPIWQTSLITRSKGTGVIVSTSKTSTGITKKERKIWKRTVVCFILTFQKIMFVNSVMKYKVCTLGPLKNSCPYTLGSFTSTRMKSKHLQHGNMGSSTADSTKYQTVLRRREDLHIQRRPNHTIQTDM